MPLYQDDQNQLYLHSRFQTVLWPGRADAEQRIWPVIRRIRPERRDLFVTLCWVLSVLSILMSTGSLVVSAMVGEVWSHLGIIAGFLLALLGPSLLAGWAGDDVRFERKVTLAGLPDNLALLLAQALTGAVLMFYSIQQLSHDAVWGLLAAVAIMVTHGLRCGYYWRRT